MRLQWSGIRARAAAFAERHKLDTRGRGDTHTFYNEFFDCFGVSRRQVAVYEQRVRNLPGDKQGFIDLFWPGVLIVEQKSAGLDLRRASDQALDYYDWLPEAQRPRYILTCDFQRWHLLDLEDGREWRFELAELKRHVEAFAFILGVQPRLHRKQSPVNRKASELMGRLHEALADTGYGGHDLELLLVRLLFILFADDTSIFNNKDQFFTLLEQRTQWDGSDLGRWLGELFEVLNTPEDERQSTLDADLAAFPYINGALFAERIRMPAFDNAMRTILLDACEFDWGDVSPAIFGSLFENVIDKVTRRRRGAHYTPEEAILKLIGPLFLDELRTEFERARALRSGRDGALKRLHDRLAALTFLDPACGAGNFLVVAYRELRELERELIKERYLRPGMAFDPGVPADKLSRLNVDQFFGIEIDEFPARIAEVALWMTDHVANTRLGEEFGQSVARIPLVAAPGIRHGDALELDWNGVLLAERCCYVLGNPPFAGKKEQSPKQKQQLRAVFANAKGAGDLDYVAAWYERAAIYTRLNLSIRCAFVSTNSVTQGEQVGLLWARLINLHNLHIDFAHRTFEWKSPTRYSAHVHVVVIGFSRVPGGDKLRLFDYPNVRGKAVEVSARHINPYLMDFRDVFVRKSSAPLSPRPKMNKGSEATDFGFLTVDVRERLSFLRAHGFNRDWLREFVGGKEFINDIQRFCLWLKDAEPRQLRQCEAVMTRLARVADARAAGAKARTRFWSRQPALFTEDRQPDDDYLLVPKVSSSQREYVPIGFCTSDVIVSGSAQYIAGRDLFVFAIVTSAMHMAWLRTVGGRTKSDYQYTVGLVYNTFPWADSIPAQRKKIEALAQAVLDARALPKNATSSLADLYDPGTMPPELRKAHRDLDAAVDRLYRPRPFASDRERVEHLFPRYEALVHPTAAAPKANRRTTRRTARQPKSDG